MVNLPPLPQAEVPANVEGDFSDEDGHESITDRIEAIEDINDPDFMVKEKSKKKSEKIRNRFDYPETVSTIGRCQGTSYESGFRIISSYNLDLKSLAKTPEIHQFLDSNFMSKTKMYNMTQKYGKLRATKHFELLKFNPELFVLGVDGKKSDVRQKYGRLLQQDKQVIIGKNEFLKNHYLTILVMYYKNYLLFYRSNYQKVYWFLHSGRR